MRLMQAPVLNKQLRNLYLEQLHLICQTNREKAGPDQLMDIHGQFMMHVYPEYADKWDFHSNVNLLTGAINGLAKWLFPVKVLSRNL